MADVLTISRRYYTRSEIAFRDRRRYNEENWFAYMGQQDFSEKTEWQNKETTPGFPIAVEHIVGTFERALTDSDDWLQVDPPGLGVPFLDPSLIAQLLQFFLERLFTPGNHAETGYGIQVLVSDAVKRALLEPLVIAKVYPMLQKRQLFKFKTRAPVGREQGNYPQYDFATDPGSPVESEVMRLAIELIPYEDYFPDPSPEKRYEIHRSRRNLYDLLANPEYDSDVVRSLLGAATKQRNLDDQRNRAVIQAERTVGTDPYEIEVFEAWGDIVDFETGEMLHENVFWTWANDRILREPTPNPFWDGTRPFVTASLLRVPGSLTGKALADHAVPMWRAMNELVNLHLDSAGRGAWGVGQVRADIMEAPEEIADGVPQGYTAVLKPNTPQGLNFYERVDEGEVSPVTLDGINRLEGFLQESMATPDTKLGQLPQRATKACVPMFSEALTRAGWKTYDQLQEGQDILAFNCETQECEWTPILRLYHYPEAETVLYHNAEWKVICTPDHKWACQRYDSRKKQLAGDIELVPIRDVTKKHMTVWTTPKKSPDGPGLNALPVHDLFDREWAEAEVLLMTQPERRAFINGLLMGEGSKSKTSEQVVFTQKSGPVLDAFRLACFLEGYRTSSRDNTTYDTRYDKWHAKRQSTVFRSPRVHVNRLEEYDAGVQPVWCPSTKYKTWVMRQGDSITLTGNTEIVQAMQASGSLYESFAARIEDTWLEPLFEKCWKLILQYSPDFMEDEMIQILGPTNTLRLNDARVSTQQRYRLLSGAHMRVRGLRGVATRERNFQKLITLINLLATNQQFADSFGQTKSYDRLWDQLIRAIGVDPEMLSLVRLDEEESAPGTAGGQLNPALAAGSGASPPNLTPGAAASPQTLAGGQAGMAANNPVANLAASEAA